MVKPSISTLLAGLSLFANAVPALAGGAPEKGVVFKLDLPPGMTVESASGHCYAINSAQCVKSTQPNPKMEEADKAANAHLAAEAAKFRREVQLQNMRYLQAQAEEARSAAPPGQQ